MKKDVIKTENEERIKALKKAREYLDPVSYLDFQFMMERGSQLANTKRQKIKADFQKLIEAEEKEREKLRLKSKAMLLKRDKFFRENIFFGFETNWTRHSKINEYENRIDPYHYMPFGITLEPGFAYDSTNKSSKSGWEKVKTVPPKYNYQSTKHIFKIPYFDFIKLEGKKEAEKARNESNDLIFNPNQLGDYKPEAVFYVLTQCYPSITEYEKNPEGYPYFINYLESINSEFTADRADEAIKKWLGYGTSEYASRMIDYFRDEVIPKNINPNDNFKYTIRQQTRDNFDPRDKNNSTTLGIPDINPNFKPWVYAKESFSHIITGAPLPDDKAKLIANDFLSAIFSHVYGGQKYRTEIISINQLADKYDFIGPARSISTQEYKSGNTSFYDRLGYTVGDDIYVYKNKYVYGNEFEKKVASNDGAFYKSYNDHAISWWPRPKTGYLYIPKLGYINPLFFRAGTLARHYTGSVFGIKAAIERVKSAFQKIEKIYVGLFEDLASGDILSASGKMTYIVTGGKYSNPLSPFVRVSSILAGKVLRIVNPMSNTLNLAQHIPGVQDIYKELDRFTGNLLSQVDYTVNFPSEILEGEPITQEDWDVVIVTSIKAGIIMFSGNPAAASISVGAGQLKEGTLGETELGSNILTLGEVAAIAYTGGMSVSKTTEMTAKELAVKAGKEYAKKKAIEVGKKEFAEATGLNETIAGRFALDLTASSVAGLSSDKSFMDALKDSADKAWRMEAARKSPYAALLIAGATEIEKKGIPKIMEDLTSPSQWFKSYSWEELGDEIADFANSIDSEDVMSTIGLAMMVSGGYISEEEALLMGAQQMAIRQIDRFYEDRKSYGTMTPEQAEIDQLTKEVNKYKVGQKIIQNTVNGKPPTKEDVLFISDNVAGPLYDSIKEILPTRYEVDGWNIALDVGVPNFPSMIPNKKIKPPKWMKLKKAEYPAVDTKKIEEKIGKKLSADIELTQDDILKIILELMPKNTPLIPAPRKGQDLRFNYVDMLGNLHVREPLKFPYDHPMLKYSYLPKKLTGAEINYMKARKEEMDIAYMKLEKAEEYAKDLIGSQETPPPAGLG